MPVSLPFVQFVAVGFGVFFGYLVLLSLPFTVRFQCLAISPAFAFATFANRQAKQAQWVDPVIDLNIEATLYSQGGGMPGSPTPGGGGASRIPQDTAKFPPPADIPSGNDDDVVARQLREAAMREADPAVREKLWDEYRKYKGVSS